MMVSTTFYLTAAAQRIWISTTPDIVSLDCNNVQKLPLDITIYAGEGIDKSKYEAYLTLQLESVVNSSVTVLYKYDSPSKVSSYSYSVPSDKYPTANRISIMAYQDAKRTVLIDGKSLNIIADNPVPFPRAEPWSSGLVYKNGEYLMIGEVLYMWGSRVSGNTPTDPKTWIQNNPNSRLWVPYPYNKLLAAQILLANYALVGSAVFDGDYMYSQQGVNASGQPTSDYRRFGTSEFTPNFSINFVTGEVVACNADITGIIDAIGGIFRGRIETGVNGKRIIIDPNTGTLSMIDAGNNEVISLNYDTADGNTWAVMKIKGDGFGYLGSSLRLEGDKISMSHANGFLDIYPNLLRINYRGRIFELGFGSTGNLSGIVGLLYCSNWPTSSSQVEKGFVYSDGGTLKIKQ